MALVTTCKENILFVKGGMKSVFVFERFSFDPRTGAVVSVNTASYTHSKGMLVSAVTNASVVTMGQGTYLFVDHPEAIPVKKE
jgi:hypothetical protein